MMYTFDEVNDATGFANGDKFASARQVKLYFTIENMELMFGECAYSQDELDEMAETVIRNQWHYETK